MELQLNGKPHEVASCDANTTLLRYLRTRAGLKGTKEGCASGDCGACTVLVGDGQQGVRAVNACITLLGSVADRQVITVEGLASDGHLHPVQQAMVDCHGSQCGFCTPGFVMSLAGLYERCLDEEAAPARQRVTDAIAGNLCRCTGYRPILAAGEVMKDYEPARLPRFAASTAASGADPILTAGGTRYFCPADEAQLQNLLARENDPRLVAGGTDMVLEISQQYRQHAVIIDLSRVEELNRVDADEEYLVIGAAVTYATLMAEVDELSAPFRDILHRLGSEQIRNRGTLGGNIANASPIADTPPMLLALDAEVECVNAGGERRWLALADFYRGYRQTLLEAGDYLAAIRIPRAALGRPHRFYKLSKRFEDDISAVMGAFVMDIEGDRVTGPRLAFGGVAATPVRAPQTEAELDGMVLDEPSIDRACGVLREEFSPITDVRASARYRGEMAGNLLRRALLELGHGVSLDVFHGAGVIDA